MTKTIVTVRLYYHLSHWNNNDNNDNDDDNEVPTADTFSFSSWHPCMLYLKGIKIFIVEVCVCFLHIYRPLLFILTLCSLYVCVCVCVSRLISKTLSWATELPARHTPWSQPVMWVWEYLCSCASELLVLDVQGGWCSGAGVSLSKLPKHLNSSWGWVQMSVKSVSD